MQGSAAAAHAQSHTERTDGHARVARKDVVIFTTDDELLLTLGPAMDDRFRSRTTDGTGAWIEAVHGRAGVALIDAATLANAPEIVRTMEAQFPAFALVVFAPAAARGQWSLALTRGSIARLLDRETLTPEAITAALAVEPRAGAAGAANSGASAGGLTPGRLRLAMIVGAIIAAAAIAGVLWFTLGGDEDAPRRTAPVATAAAPGGAATTTTASQEAATPAAAALSVPELLSAARVAFSERHYIEPASGSALDLYARARAAEPGNAEAEDGVRRVIAIAAAQLQGEIKAGQLDDAAKLLGSLQEVAPDDPTLAAAARDLASARPKWLAARAREAIAADQRDTADRLIGELAALGTEKAAVQDLRRSLDAKRKEDDLTRAVADARAALAGVALLDTTASGPRAKLAALQQIDRRNSQVVAFQRDYQAALVRAGREAIRAGDLDSADELLAAAAGLGGTRDVNDARKELQAAHDSAAAREQQRAESARQRVERSAQAAPPPPPPKMPKAKRRGAPKYPPAAERSGIEGSVVVEFGLTPEGHTRDIKVVESTPPGVFDDAAVDAVRDWRFEPINAQDAARLPRSSVRLAFRIGDR